MDLSWYALASVLQVTKLSNTLDLATSGFQNQFRHTYQNPLKRSPVSERPACPLQNYICISLLTSGLESFGHKSTPSDRPWIEVSQARNGLELECQKVNFLEYLGQWNPFTFQPALRALQQPHKHSHSLQLATDTEVAHHYIQ